MFTTNRSLDDSNTIKVGILLQNRSMERIEAREIVLSDGVTNAKLTPNSLIFISKSGYEAEEATITASRISLGGRYSTEIKPEGLILRRDGVPRFGLSVREIGASLAFKDGFGLMGTMLDETTMELINNGGMLSMRPEHIFLQKGEADALLAASSIRIRDTDKYKAILAARGESTIGRVLGAAGADARRSDAGDAGTSSRSANAADGPAAGLLRRPRSARTLWAHRYCRQYLRCSSSTMSPHRLLLAP
jgi:hypothetical protein